MPEKTVGVAIYAPSASSAVSQIRRAEEMGIRAAWLTSGGAVGDPLTLLAAAASQTERILLGTSIIQIWSRHPVTAAQQVQAIADLAPGRFRLGIGTGHRQAMERTFGADFRAPLGHLGEYLRTVKGLLRDGRVDFEGRFHKAHAAIAGPVEVPVMASALGPRAFELCGAEADGAISWVCPHRYLRDTALPALRVGAEGAERSVPPLIAHAPVCVHENPADVREAAPKRLGHFPSLPFYARMLAAAGFPRAQDTGWTDEMLDAVVISGDESSVAARIDEAFRWGASELLATVIGAGSNPTESEQRTLRLLADLSK